MSEKKTGFERVEHEMMYEFSLKERGGRGIKLCGFPLLGRSVDGNSPEVRM